MFHTFTNSGALIDSGDVYFQKMRLLWLAGLYQVARKTGWLDFHDFIELTTDDPEHFKTLLTSLKTSIILFFAKSHIKAKLSESTKYNIFLAWFPDLQTRPWLDFLSRFRRQAFGRFLLAQHRLIWETGRWSVPRLDPLSRLCPHCVTQRNILYKTYLQRPCKDAAVALGTPV